MAKAKGKVPAAGELQASEALVIASGSPSAGSKDALVVHSTQGNLFQLMTMREDMISEGRDTAAIDALIRQESDAFKASLEAVLISGAQVMNTPTLVEARKKVVIGAQDVIASLITTSGPRTLGK